MAEESRRSCQCMTAMGTGRMDIETGDPVSRSSGNTGSGNHSRAASCVFTIIVVLSLFPGAVLLIAALLRSETARVEPALAAFFLTALVLLLPGMSQIAIGTGGLGLRLAQADKKIHRNRNDQLLSQVVWSGRATRPWAISARTPMSNSTTNGANPAYFPVHKTRGRSLPP